MEKCDECNSIIENGKCSCSYWFEREKQPKVSKILENSILAYNEMNIDFPLSGDHYTGSCIVLFKGDLELCKKVKKFIEDQGKDI